MTGIERVCYYSVWIGVLIIWTLIGAISLRIAIVVHNTIAGGASSPGIVSMPTFSQAAQIVVGTTLFLSFAGRVLFALAPEGMTFARPKKQFEYNAYRADKTPPPQQPAPLRTAAKFCFWFMLGFVAAAKLIASSVSTTLVRASAVTAWLLIISSVPCGVVTVIIFIATITK